MTESTEEVRKEVIEALRLVQGRELEKAEQVLEQGIAEGSENPEQMAVLYSTLGMILKKQGKIDQAWKAYQNAENVLPDEPLLKIILARFLLNESCHYDQAIKKGKELLQLAAEIPAFSHQAYSIMGLSYIRKGNSRKAIEMLDKSMKERFEGMPSSENIDFSLVEAMIRDGIEMEQCHHFLEAASELARSKREFKTMARLQQILDSFEATHV